MSTNATVMVPLTTELTYTSHLSEELSHRINQALRYGLIPCTSVLGIAGNMASIVILAQRGFKKCSNVLLMALSVSDVLFLTGINNIPQYIYVENIPSGFRFSETINYVFYILCMAFTCAYVVGLSSALVIPAFITGERLMVISSPLKVYWILTPRRVLFLVCHVYILSGAYFVYRYIICLYFKHDVILGFTIGGIWQTDVYTKHIRNGLFVLIESIFNYMTGIIPISIVTLGCVVIGIKVALITHRRKQLTSGQVKPGTKTSTSRTTKTLLSICVLYIVCCGFSFALGNVNIGSGDEVFALQKVLGSLQDLLLCVNCVGDFVIYVRANNRFRRPCDTRSG